MSTEKGRTYIYPDVSTQNLGQQLIEDENALAQAADEVAKWEKEVARLSRQVEALKQAVNVRG